jgi:hypothetical protein
VFAAVPSVAAYGQIPQTSTDVVRSYYKARDHFDLKTAKRLEAKDMVLVDESGQRHPLNPELLGGFMDYEKTMHGRWSCRILDYSNGGVEAEITESNDYYAYLGIGKSIAIQRYKVVDDQIKEIVMVNQRYTGRDQHSAYQEFIRWISTLPAKEQNGVLRDGQLFFDGEGARKQLPLLKGFRRAKYAHQPPISQTGARRNQHHRAIS